MDLKFTTNRLNVIEPLVRGKKVFDLGCVDYRPDGLRKYRESGLHLFLNKNASKVVGLDIDEKGVKQLRDEGYDVICGNVENVNYHETFDCVVAGEIMEHLSNPGLFLDGIRKNLKDDGILILTVPNAFSILSFWRIFRRGIVKVHADHTCWYDPITISQLLKRHQYEISDMYLTNKSKWHEKKHMWKLKYQLFKLFCFFRRYLSGNIIVVAKSVS